MTICTFLDMRSPAVPSLPAKSFLFFFFLFSIIYVTRSSRSNRGSNKVLAGRYQSYHFHSHPASRGMRHEINFNGGMRDKNTSAGVGFAHFDRRDAG